MWSFFLQAVLGDDAFHAAYADVPSRLVQFLSDDLGGGFRVKKSMANDLPNHFVGSAVIGARPSFLALQSEGALVLEEMKQLIVALFGIAELFGRLLGSQPFALAFMDHGEFEQEVVVGMDFQAALRSNPIDFVMVKEDHRNLLVEEWVGRKNRRNRQKVK